jgi:hypothetical protein
MIRLMRLKAKVDDHGSTVVHVAAKHGLKDILQFFNRMGTSSLFYMRVIRRIMYCIVSLWVFMCRH